MLSGLFASIFALFIGPLVYQTFGPLNRLERATSGVVLIVIGGIVIMDIMPTVWQQIGWFAPLLMLAGLMGPSLVEKSFADKADSTHKLTVFLGILGLLLHTFIDGTMLSMVKDHAGHNEEMAIAIIIHRLPVGLTVWWLLLPILKGKRTLLTLFSLAIATTLGFFFAEQIEPITSLSLVSWLQAFVAGSLLHVVIYKPHTDGCLHTSHQHEDAHHQSSRQKLGPLSYDRWSLTGYSIGLLFLYLIGISHGVN